MVISEVSICNMALTRIGQSRISSLTQAGVLAELSNLYYEATLNELLSMYEWSFAIKRSALGASGDTNLSAYSMMYNLPSDYIRVLTLLDEVDHSDITDKWEIEGRQLLTNKSPVYIKYIGKITNPNKLPQPFIEALYLRIASKMVVKITQDQSLMSMLFQEYTVAMTAAMAYIGGHSKEDIQPNEWWGE